MTTEILPPVGEDIILAVFEAPSLALLDQDKANAFFNAVVNETRAVADLKIEDSKAREEIRSMARKVTRSKTLLDKARLDMTADLRKRVTDINEAGKAIIGRLEALADEVRKPLTDWEAAEELREKRIDKTFADLKAAMIVTITDTSETVRGRGEWAFGLEITRDEFGKRYLEAKELRDLAVDALKEAMAGLDRQEAERAELARLRREADERDERDRVEREAQEAAERRRLADEEARRIEAEAAEQLRLRKEQQAADEARRIREAEERAAEEAAQRVAQEKEAELIEAKRRADEAEDLLRKKAIAEQQEQQEQERREKDKRHRAQIMGEIKIAIMAAGKITDVQATGILKSIAAGSIPRLRVEF